ncbi:MAG TPA: hypothetical protein GXX29_00635 [Firmicutes bacterium]|nr:hypothetical protein [Bacillota bacterium]
MLMNEVHLVQVPVTFLIDPRLRPTAQLLWLALWISGPSAGIALDQLLSPTRLSKITGLSCPTVRKGIAQLIEHRWLIWPVIDSRIFPSGIFEHCRIVYLPSDLITDHKVSPQAKMLYGYLQYLPNYVYWKREGRTTYQALSQILSINVKTVRQAMYMLRSNGWIKTVQANQKAEIKYTLTHPVVTHYETLWRHVDKAEFRGETLMKEWLSVLIDSAEYVDNGYFGFLINPETNEQLQLDRYYMNFKVAFEFNGDQHYKSSALFDKETVAKQMRRDRIKKEICKHMGITLVIIHWNDLHNIGALLQNLPNKLPLRDLSQYESHLAFLQSETSKYQESTIININRTRN